MTGTLGSVVGEVFQFLAQAPGTLQVSVSCFEIYNSQVRCLLCQQTCAVREDARRSKGRERGSARSTLGTVQIAGLCDQQVRSAGEASSVLHSGIDARSVGITAVNESSSRSHAVYRLSLSSCASVDQLDGRPIPAKLIGQIQMVDLAGSERGADRDDEKDQGVVREASEINRSLLALKECIRALLMQQTSKSDQATHTPFRSSTLTHILKDALWPRGGIDTQVILLTTTAPTNKDVLHTLNSLRYADRLKQIKVKQRDARGGKLRERRRRST